MVAQSHWKLNANSCGVWVWVAARGLFWPVRGKLAQPSLQCFSSVMWACSFGVFSVAGVTECTCAQSVVCLISKKQYPDTGFSLKHRSINIWIRFITACEAVLLCAALLISSVFHFSFCVVWDYNSALWAPRLKAGFSVSICSHAQTFSERGVDSRDATEV